MAKLEKELAMEKALQKEAFHKDARRRRCWHSKKKSGS